jgi:hypothetical protein
LVVETEQVCALETCEASNRHTSAIEDVKILLITIKFKVKKMRLNQNWLCRKPGRIIKSIAIVMEEFERIGGGDSDANIIGEFEICNSPQKNFSDFTYCGFLFRRKLGFSR